MSSKPVSPIRSAFWWTSGLAATCLAQSTLAQETDLEDLKRSAEPENGVIDVLAPAPTSEVDELLVEQCEREREAATISGEIVVCRQVTEVETGGFDKDRWERDYAEESAFRNDPRTPDFIVDCHDLGFPFGCVRVGRVPPPALIIDVTALPEAPPGSDADRIGRGLAPRGNDAASDPTQAELVGLSPPSDEVARESEISQEESAAPAAGQ